MTKKVITTPVLSGAELLEKLATLEGAEDIKAGVEALVDSVATLEAEHADKLEQLTNAIVQRDATIADMMEKLDNKVTLTKGRHTFKHNGQLFKLVVPRSFYKQQLVTAETLHNDKELLEACIADKRCACLVPLDKEEAV
jgi:hypothetical protein